jgi:hydrogenase 3 maturation protease
VNLPDQTKKELESVLEGGRTLLMGIGNILRGDDAFGPELVNSLQGIPLPMIDAGTTPENQIGSSARHSPDTVLLADAVHLDAEPGTCRLLTRDQILSDTGFTTHDLSPALFMERLEETTGAKVMMLAVQPAQLGFGTAMSGPVRETLDALAEFIRGCLEDA